MSVRMQRSQHVPRGERSVKKEVVKPTLSAVCLIEGHRACGSLCGILPTRGSVRVSSTKHNVDHLLSFDRIATGGMVTRGNGEGTGGLTCGGRGAKAMGCARLGERDAPTRSASFKG